MAYVLIEPSPAAGNFQPGEEGCILKKYCHREAECLSQLARDEHLSPYAPDYHGVVDKDGERYTRMQDLLLAFDCPSVMDCKMGLRLVESGYVFPYFAAGIARGGVA